MKDEASPNIQQIVEALTQRQIQITGPTKKGGESVYRVNEHTLTETELRTVANEGQLTSWTIFNYVRLRDQNRMH